MSRGREPDWERLKKIGARVDELLEQRAWNKKAFDELLAQAKEASPDHGDFYEFLFVHADPSWL